jgi:hypothetical protein
MSESYSPRDYSHALRVTFAYDADGITLKRVKRVAMRVRAPVSPAPGEGVIGYWLAVENGAGEVVYHIPLHDPFRYDREVYEADAVGRPSRKLSEHTSGTFEVLVPDLPGGARLVVHGPPHGPAAAAHVASTHAAPLIAHGMDELRRLAGEEPPA